MHVMMKISWCCQKNKQESWHESRWAFQQCWTKDKQTTARAELKDYFRKINKSLDISQDKLLSDIEQKSKQATERDELKDWCSRNRETLVLNTDSKEFQE